MVPNPEADSSPGHFLLARVLKLTEGTIAVNLLGLLKPLKKMNFFCPRNKDEPVKISSKVGVVGRTMAPNDAHALIPRTCEYLVLDGTLQMQLLLKTLK